MTKPMADPTPYAQKRRSLAPTPITRANKKRGASAAGDIATARKASKSNGSAESAAEYDPDKPLTEKQRQFTKCWAQGDTVPNAALRAGFAQESVAYRLVRQPNILALKQKYEAKYEAASDMSRQKVMDGLLEAVEMAKLMAEPMTMVAGWREVGKMCGYYAPVETRVKVDVTGNIVLSRLNSLSDEELLVLIAKSEPQALPAPEHDESKDE